MRLCDSAINASVRAIEVKGSVVTVVTGIALLQQSQHVVRYRDRRLD